ncbi:MAG: response regulator [Bacteroidota bacterium]
MPSTSKKGLRLLVIEDSKSDVELIRIHMDDSKIAYEMEVCETLAEGFLAVEENAYSLVLLDLNLPDSLGFSTLRRFLERAAHLPVIVLTGVSNQKLGTEAVRAGAQDYLVKGNYDATQLGNVIRYSMERFRIQLAAEERATNQADQNKRLQALKQMASLGDWEMDIVSNAMSWSPEMFQIFEIPQNSLQPLLSDYLRYVHREDRSAVEEFFAKASQKEEHGPLEHRIFLNNRITKHLTLRTRIKFDDRTNKILLLGSVQDITPRKEGTEAPVDDETPSSQPDYARQLFNQISFNIRTPLSTTVHLFYLLEQTNLSNKQLKLVQDLKTTIDDLSFTLSNLVNLSILTNDNLLSAKDHFRPLDILESIQRVMSFKAQQNNREVDIYIDPRLAVSVQGDSNKLAQLFFCMMELSFLHSLPGAFVKLRCINEDEPTGSEIQMTVQLEYSGRLPAWQTPNPEASADEIFSLLQPMDNGQGREQLLGTVFQRLCDQLRIERKNNANKGAVFMDMTIPLKRGRLEESTVPEKPERNIQVLLVEDHPMQQIATKQVLTTWSDRVSVSIAGNGQVALNKAREETYDIILMDLQMPVMDGMTATSNLRLFTPTPIIALTASTSKQEEDRCYQVGMNDYLAKPFQPEDLYRRIMVLIHDNRLR